MPGLHGGFGVHNWSWQEVTTPVALAMDVMLCRCFTIAGFTFIVQHEVVYAGLMCGKT